MINRHKGQSQKTSLIISVTQKFCQCILFFSEVPFGDGKYEEFALLCQEKTVHDMVRAAHLPLLLDS